MATYTTGDDNFGVSSYIVDPTLGFGNFQTISAALAAASSAGFTGDIFIRPGTYTENPTLIANVNLVAFASDDLIPTVSIVGKCSFSATGTTTLANIRLITNGDFCLEITGANVSSVRLKFCSVISNGNTAINFASSNASSLLQFLYCIGDIKIAGSAMWSCTSAGVFNLFYSIFNNSVGSTTANTNSAGVFSMQQSIIFNPITSSGTSSIGIGNGSFINAASINTTALTIGGSGSNTMTLSSASSGTASAISISTALSMTLNSIYSSNVHAITGVGTLTSSFTNFGSTSSLINTTTQIGGIAQGSVSQNPTAGYIGEQISSAVTTVGLSTGIAKTITSITLTAGVWDVSAIGSVNGTGSITDFEISVSTTNNTIEGNLGDLISRWATSANLVVASLSVPVVRKVPTTSTTYYLVTQASFSATCNAQGRITATRVA